MKNCLLIWSVILILCSISCNKKISKPPENEIERIIKKSIKYRDTLLNPKVGDSLLSLALTKSIIIDQPKTNAEINIALLRYLSLDKLNEAQGRFYFDEAVKNSRKIGDKTLEKNAYFSYCNFLLRENNPSKAMILYNMIDSPNNLSTTEVEKKILLSNINEKQNFPAEQLRNLLAAHYLSVDLENDSLQIVTLQLLSDYYYYQKKIDRAMDYNTKVKELLRKKHPMDSIAWYYSEENRLFLITQSSDTTTMLGLAKKIIKYTNKSGNIALASNVQSSLRTYFFNHHDLKNLYLWYKEFPIELEVLKKHNSSFYFRTKAYLDEYNNSIDSAKINWKLAEFNNEPNPHLNFMYYNRLGEFLDRIGDSVKAINSYEKALQYALQTNVYNNQLNLSDKISNYYLKQGNSELTLENMKIANQAKSNWIKMLNDDNIKNIELSNILAQKELEHEKSQDNLERKHYTQYLIISLFIILMIMTMIGISFYNIPSWWIKSMGYISFLMFFESIILLVDHKLHELTNGSPILILIIKIIILSFMFPTHHWIEERFVDILLKGVIKRKIHGYLSQFKTKKKVALSE